MRSYLPAGLIALVGVGMLAGAAVIANHRDEPAPVAAAGDDRGGEVWGGDYFPNIALTTHDGERVRFFDDLIEGKVVAINFIYTYCPDTCPVETARLLQVAGLLGDRLGDDVFFYSITIDPEYDTQPVLAAFADSWRIPDGWKFLTGDKDDIVLLRKKLGMRLDDVRSGELSDHTVNLLIGNQKTGRWMKRSPFENPYVLANQLGSWLHGWKLPSEKKRDYSEAPELRTISDGEYIFRNQCSACHTIGRGDLREPASRHIGPDLYNVSAQRERGWLERWIAEPDAMIEEEDPLAIALVAEWNGLPMPNLRLTDKDVDALLGYIDQESRRVRDLQAGHRADLRGHGDAAAGRGDRTGMDHGAMDHGAMDHGAMDHGAMDHGAMDHGDRRARQAPPGRSDGSRPTTER